MADESGKRSAETVRRMFARIAKRYNIANRWMTWGHDARWRREVIRLAALPKTGRLLDIGTGTGDLAFEALHQDPSAWVVGADFTLEMMLEGRLRLGNSPVHWSSADALQLPFIDETFDALVSGYLLRNVSDITQALKEQYRVLKRGGRMVSLDTTRIPGDFWHLPARWYVRRIIPLIGRFVAGDRNAYEYLTSSTELFLSAEELAGRIEWAGFKDVGYKRLMGGTMAIHWGLKL